ncbi:flavonol synthase 3-like [Pyrus ussuriensis x Pyrus communis]|uniref:Flavonol synthase 3-like n=1 Tax=Pyrus ussuriensis x Pyrus communis TaxID=2448454 RepID=A0A5N5F7F1_9ROSA|nr:flavonol synthase 3-like [Pyrus ussuriensis x Pyrus communis]
MKAMIDACHGFFTLPDEEREEFKSSNDLLEMFNCGTSYNHDLDKFLMWRDFLKARVHPEFYALSKPARFSEKAWDWIIHHAMNTDRGFEILAANYYPPCPQPESAIGLPRHTDSGLFTLLIQNEMNGLEVEHNGKWVTIDVPPNRFFVNLADQMRILTNGKYKSVIHRAT